MQLKKEAQVPKIQLAWFTFRTLAVKCESLLNYVLYYSSVTIEHQSINATAKWQIACEQATNTVNALSECREYSMTNIEHAVLFVRTVALVIMRY